MAINREKVLEAAQKFVEKKKYDKAVLEYQKIIKEDPNDARTLLKIGDLQSKAELYADAIETYERVGNYYGQQGFALKAIAVFKQIREIVGKHVPQMEDRFSHIAPKLAELYQTLGLTSDALAALDEVATRLQRQQRDPEAIDVFRKIVEMDPTNPLPHLRLAEALSRVKDAESAVREFGIAASLLVKLGRRDDAIKVFERLLHHKPDPANARNCAELYLERGQPADGMQALAKLQVCFQANPKDLDTLALLARAFAAIGQAGQGIEVQKEMARLAKEQGKLDMFKQLVERLQRLAPNDEGVKALLTTGAHSVAPASSPPSSRAGARQQAPAAAPAHGEEEPSYETGEIDDGEIQDADELGLKSEAPSPMSQPPFSAPRYERPGAPPPLPVVQQDSYDEAPELVVGGSDDANEYVEDSVPPPDVTEAIAQALHDAATFRRVRLFAKAVDTIREVLELAPTSRDLRAALRDVFLETRQYDQAALQMLALASLHIDEGELEEAARSLYDVLSIQPENARAQELLEGLGYDVAGATDVAPAVVPQAPASDTDDISSGYAEYVQEDGPLPAYDLEDTGRRAAAGPPGDVGDMDEPFASSREAPLPSFPLDAPESDPSFDLVQGHGAADESDGYPATGQTGSRPPPHTDLEEALEEVDFYASRGLFDDARAILTEQLHLHPAHILLTERLTELDTQEQGARGGSGTREVPRNAVDRSFDIAASLDAIENLDTANDIPAAREGDKQIDVEEVFAKFKEGVAKQVSADDSQSHYDLGVAYKEMGLIEDAIREFDVAAQDPKRECVCRSMIGNIQTERGRIGDAIAAFLQALNAPACTPEQETVLSYDLGASYEATKQPKEALAYFQRVLRKDPNHRDVQERVRRLSNPGGKPAPRAAAVGDDEFERAFDDIIGDGKLP